MMSGLNVSVEMNGDIILDTGDIIIRSLVVMMILVPSIQSIVTLTLVSTVSGSVTLHIIVCKVPSYSSSLVGIIRVVVGVGTVCIDMCDSMYYNTGLSLRVTLAPLTEPYYEDEGIQDDCLDFSPSRGLHYNQYSMCLHWM